MLKLLRNLAGISVIDQSLVSGVNFITGIYLAYKLGISAFGQYSLILLVAQFCIEIQRSIINSPMFIFSAMQENKTYFSTLHPLQLLVSLFLSLIAGAFIFLSGFLFDKWQISSFAIAAMFFCYTKLQQEFYRRYFFAKQQPAKALYIDIVYIMLLLIGLAIFVIKDNLNVQVLLCLGSIASFAPLLFFRIEFEMSWQNLKETFNKHYHFSKWLFASSLANYLSSNLLLFIGSAMLGSSAAGILKLSQYIMGGMIILYQSAENIIPYHLAKFVNENQIEQLKDFFKKYLLIALGITAIHGVLIYSLLSIILNHIDKGHYDEQQYQLAVGYIIFSFLLTITYSLQYWLRAFQQTGVIFAASLVSAGLVIIFGKAFIDHYHVMGILLGFFLTQISTIIIYALYSSKVYHASRPYPVG